MIDRDMWLTGFDALCLHTIYVDKPMRGHGLMQAIAGQPRPVPWLRVAGLQRTAGSRHPSAGVARDRPGVVIDVFAAAGLPKPDISLLSEGFLAEVREMPQKNLAVELCTSC